MKTQKSLIWIAIRDTPSFLFKCSFYHLWPIRKSSSKSGMTFPGDKITAPFSFFRPHVSLEFRLKYTLWLWSFCEIFNSELIQFPLLNTGYNCIFVLINERQTWIYKKVIRTGHSVILETLKSNGRIVNNQHTRSGSSYILSNITHKIATA